MAFKNHVTSQVLTYIDSNHANMKRERKKYIIFLLNDPIKAKNVTVSSMLKLEEKKATNNFKWNI